MVSNEVINQNDTRVVVNKGLTASRDKAGFLKLRGDNDTSPFSESVGSKQVIKESMPSQKHIPFIHFITKGTYWFMDNHICSTFYNKIPK